MADQDTSLPTRTESAGDIDVFISDSGTPSQKLGVNADGSIDAVVTATDLDVRDLDASQDNVAISDGTDQLEVNGDGSINAVVTATDLDIRDLDAASDSVAAHLHDESGVAYSLTNPLPVEQVSDQSGDEICDYNTSSAIVKDASVNHDYTVTAAKTFIGDQVWASGSGKIKVEVQVETAPAAGTYDTKFVGFNSTSSPNVEIPLRKILKQVATAIVRIVITNRDNQAQDLYSTLTGIEA